MPIAMDFNFCEQLDATLSQTAKAIGSSTLIVRKRIAAGRYTSYLDGGRRKVIVASVLADRARLLAEGAVMAMAPGPGRGHKGPRKPPSAPEPQPKRRKRKFRRNEATAAS
jgi:hypothetical protein